MFADAFGALYGPLYPRPRGHASAQIPARSEDWRSGGLLGFSACRFLFRCGFLQPGRCVYFRGPSVFDIACQISLTPRPVMAENGQWFTPLCEWLSYPAACSDWFNLSILEAITRYGPPLISNHRLRSRSWPASNPGANPGSGMKYPEPFDSLQIAFDELFPRLHPLLRPWNPRISVSWQIHEIESFVNTIKVDGSVFVPECYW